MARPGVKDGVKEGWHLAPRLRNLNHVVYHAGQIVQLARHFAGDAWQTLSVAPGTSEEFNASMRARYRDWWS